MSQKLVELIPLTCIRCQTPVPAQPDEVAWVCASCGQGLVLHPTPQGKTATGYQDIFFSNQVGPGKTGNPFWVSSGKVTITRREKYKGNEDRTAQAFWSAPRLFFIPGWAAPIGEIINAGVHFLNTPFTMQPGGPVPFRSVVTLPDDMKALAEFMVMSIEAGRRDALKQLDFDLNVALPQLWILP